MQRYLETRTTPNQLATQAADVARHLLPRQHLGKVVVVCEKPVITISVLRKSWMKLSRSLQRERASTLNAEKILQLTHDITHMQHMNFVTKLPRDYPQADVFFVTPDELDQLPANCRSLYVLADMSAELAKRLATQLPERALAVDYTSNETFTTTLLPKYELEKLLPVEWQHVENFMTAHGIAFHELATNPYGALQLDEAIDVILNTSKQFLRVTDDFLELLAFCQPTNASHIEQREYELIAALNRRIAALTPGTLSQQFAQTFGEDDASLHDPAFENQALLMAVL